MISPFDPAATAAAGFAYLNRTEDTVRGVYAVERFDWRYGTCATLDGYVARYGRPYHLGRRPAGLGKGPPKSCFATCRETVASHPERLRYVEGFAVVEHMPFPFHHAAVYDVHTRSVFDLVLPDGDLPAVIVGFVFAPAAVAGAARAGCLLDDGRGRPTFDPDAVAALTEDVPAHFVFVPDPPPSPPERNRRRDPRH